MAISAGRFRSGSFNRPESAPSIPVGSNKGTSLRELQLQAQLAGQIGQQASDANDLFGLARVDNSGYTIVPDYLEPIGDSGFYITPNEPADPTDCERYPNSFFCGGGLAWDGSGAIGLGNAIAGIGIGEIVTNGSETCVRIDANLFLIPLPSGTVCYRHPSARPLPPRPEPPPIPEPEEPEYIIPPQWHPLDFPATGSGCIHIARYQYWSNSNPQRELRSYQTDSTSQTQSYVIGRPYGYWVWVGKSAIFSSGRDAYEGHWFLMIVSADHTGKTHYNEHFFNFYTEITSIPPQVIDIYSVQLSGQPPCISDPPTTAPAPPYRPNGDPMCDCEETQDLLRLIARRLGTDSYPVTTPKSLVDSENITEQQQSLTELLFWTIKQMDGLAGQFPIEIEIKDADPSQSGDQARKVKVPNIAEGIAELLGLNIKTSVNSDIHTSFLMRLAAEVIATKNAALVTQDYAKANASYLGYKGNTVKRQVNYGFNVTKLDKLESILSESEKSIIGWQDEDKNTVQAYLEKLMFAAGIIKQAFFRPNSEKDKLLEQIANVLGLNNQNDEAVDDRWKEFLKAINDPDGGFNRNSPITPKVTDSVLDIEATGDK